jgi:biopolymer transport protein ExbD
MELKMRTKAKKIARLNLIPILDAIFIFIFFLLMSAQFLDIYEIHANTPATKEITEKEEQEKKPLNLKVIISSEHIIVKTGMNSEIVGKYLNNDKGLTELQQKLTTLKENHPSEKTAIIIPDNKVKYKSIIPVIDHVKVATIKGKESELFKLIVFENK